MYKTIERFSMGIGDRFGFEGEAQLQALSDAWREGRHVLPVWNKSYREHEITGTRPDSVREEADAAVKKLGWTKSYYVDADHISMDNVDIFLSSCDFFTLDVADCIGQSSEQSDIDQFVNTRQELCGEIAVPGLEEKLAITEKDMRQWAEKYLYAVKEAGRLYRHIVERRGNDEFVTEVSMDETATPQTPAEILLIIAAACDEGIPLQTVAPKFSGEFNKGVDYVGDIDKFAVEFRQDVAVVKFAIEQFDVPASLKLSMHSGSDKFSIYPVMQKILAELDAGLHLKTAGTTWLEEICGLAAAGGAGLEMAKRFYSEAIDRYDELCGPYAPVLDIEKDKLPAVSEVNSWSSNQFTATLLHDLNCPDYNLNFRQLLHVAYKLAAEAGDEYRQTIEACSDAVNKQVYDNLLKRHIRAVFPAV